jgi:hypothetical protein
MELMEGLTLLSTETVGCVNPAIMQFCCAMFIIVGLITLVASIIAGIVFDTDTALIGLLFTIIATMIGVGCGAISDNPQHNVYKVTIDESVSMVEFHQRYEIVDQDGLIYEIVEKDVEE